MSDNETPEDNPNPNGTFHLHPDEARELVKALNQRGKSLTVVQSIQAWLEYHDATAALEAAGERLTEAVRKQQEEKLARTTARGGSSVV